MIIKLINVNDQVLKENEAILCCALLRFMEASKDVMHDDIRHKKLEEAFHGAVKAFSSVGFDVLLVDEGEYD